MLKVILILLVATSCWGQEIKLRDVNVSRYIADSAWADTVWQVDTLCLTDEGYYLPCADTAEGTGIILRSNGGCLRDFGIECEGACHRCHPAVTDSAILCQPYFDLDIPDDIKNSVLWMFCDSIVYEVSADLDSKIRTNIVYYTYFGAMTYYEYQTSECPDNRIGCCVAHPTRVEHGLRDYPQPFATIWKRRVMWRLP